MATRGVSLATRSRQVTLKTVSSNKVALIGAREPSRRSYVLLLQISVLCLLVFPFVSSAFRDNDQAAILSGSWQIAHHQASFLRATFYNFDKQWGAFLALSTLFRVFPRVHPVLAGNVMLAALAALAWLSLGFRTGRARNAPFPLLLPILLSPVLILYMPFFGTGWLSLALLLLAFFFMGDVDSKSSRLLGLLLLAAAAACRGDVVLAIPAMALSQMSRARLRNLLLRPLLWLAAGAAIAPVFLGKALAGAVIPDANPLSFDPKAYFAFLLFGMTPAVIALLCISIITFLFLALQKHRFWFFYASIAFAPLIPLGFYSVQLYTLRYLFLTIVSVLFVVSSRRFAWLWKVFIRDYGRPARWTAAGIVMLTVAPWLVGLNVPALNHPHLTVSNPTRFPTGDGRFPMGAYLGFQWQVFFRDHLAIDHNQQIWQAAQSVKYETCSDRTVPFLFTPMSNFIELAIRLQGKTPRLIDYLAQSPCGLAYLDARSVIRGYRPTDRDGPMFQERITFVSSSDNGQLVARIDASGKQTKEGQSLEELHRILEGRNTEIFLRDSRSKMNWHISVEPGLKYAVFSGQPCQISIVGNAAPMQLETLGLIRGAWTGNFVDEDQTATANCQDSFSGWARTVLPAYMGSGSRY